MSRQNDIKALLNLRDMITETTSYINITQEELAQYEACEKELTGTQFVFEPLPTNHEEKAKARFFKEWVDKYSDTTPVKKKILLVYTIVMVLLGIATFVDMIFGLGFFFNVEEVLAIKSHGGGAFISYVCNAVFFICLTVFPNFFNIPMIPIGIIAAFLTKELYEDLFGIPVFLLTLAIFVLVYLAQLFVSLLYKGLSKKPKLNTSQKAIVAEERQKDVINAEKNVDKEIADKAEWQKWWDVHKYELDAQMNVHMSTAQSAIKKAEELQEKIDNSDVLGPNEKHVETIDWLIYILEGHRADSIKEALQQYDIMQHNEKMLEIEKEKYNLEVARVKQEHEDRQKALQQERLHQMRMEAEAARTANLQSQIAYNTAEMARSAEKARRDAAFSASQAASAREQALSQLAAITRNDYYN